MSAIPETEPVRYREDADLMPEVQAAVVRGAHPAARILLWVFGLGFLLFGLWSAVTHVDEVTKGEGRIISSLKNQIVQHLEGGIVTAIQVKEGDIVKKGQVLLRIENKDGVASFREKRTEYLALLARAARLSAEAGGKKSVDFPAEVTKEAPEIAKRELAAFRSRMRQFDQEVKTLQEQVLQREQTLKEQKSLVASLTTKVESLTQEARATQRMVANRSMSRLELVRLQRDLADVSGQLRTEKLKLPRLQSSIEEARRKIAERTSVQRAEIGKELNEARNAAAVLRERLADLRFRAEQTEVRSPVRGTVKSLRVSTKGGVVKAGEALVEIVPLEDALLVEAKVRPSDIAFLRRGQPALVKITAYDYAIYGGLDGEVVRIGADTIEDRAHKGETFYRVYVRTRRSYLERDGKNLPIIPGMTASVSVKTGRKSVLSYLLKPITKSSRTAPAGP